MRYFAIPRLTSTGPGKLSIHDNEDWIRGQAGKMPKLKQSEVVDVLGERNSVIGVDAKKEASIEGLSEHGHELDNGPR
ncbi:uncharacterized protein CCOS01_01561 [Colletotrichum costaricense]|uniref:Uncharacterized protein n=2 Tax=Colletotrichum acutatum species complex TaxID=2707335 RepID=A0AAI9ZD04_9PEZI|nr:uncharacterized protein CCOS01_01561 [Colletotrichum costaricense]XP_060379323.1 uncharacterized protein CTAM01_09979 [Colletotrichum tamarilloi]KAI3529258.1 hypothetical protein CSPX01_15642 [Colletotrichum filicis]KAK1492185.1 hypothetical protein CTAM01_09979 [Colletotrichum tamarilloi]KAK1540247.1 hypothetical protein CCOS01_01561 [Colletotrichum costaricense]